MKIFFARKVKLFLFLMVCASLFGIITSAHSSEVFDLTCSLTEGGFRIELDEKNPYKGVRVTVNSSNGQRYEVTQRIIKPLESNNPPHIMAPGFFVIRGQRGTNRFGNFRLSPNDMPVDSESVIYGSGSTGEADSFTFYYGIRNSETLQPGTYFGKVALTLTALSSVQPPVTKVIDVIVNLQEAKGIQNIDVTMPRGGNIVTLKAQKDTEQLSEVLFTLHKNTRGPLRIFQVPAGPIESREGDVLADDAVVYRVIGAQNAKVPTTDERLTTQPSDVYVLPAGKEADAQFAVAYRLSPLSNQKPGMYSTQVNFIAEDSRGRRQLGTIQLRIENERIFDLRITPQDRMTSIEFNDLKPNAPPRQSEVMMEIKTNLGRKYQVTQEMRSGLTNSQGQEIPEAFFTMRTDSLHSKGRLAVPEKQPVKKGQTTLYISDAYGSPDSFKVIYELTCSPESRAGNYTAMVTYSLLEL